MTQAYDVSQVQQLEQLEQEEGLAEQTLDDFNSGIANTLRSPSIGKVANTRPARITHIADIFN